MLNLYRIAAALIYCCLWPFMRLSARRGSRKWRQRAGHHNGPTVSKSFDLWLHASSVGEVNVVEILCDCLIRLRPEISIYLTVMTETGMNQVRRLFGENRPVGFFPVDHGPAVRRFLNTIEPRAAVFVETEIWPNMITALGARRIPIILANGRLSEKARKRYRLFRPGMRKVFANYSMMFLQSERDRQRYLSIGAPPDRMIVIGNLKLDAPPYEISEEEKAGIRNRLPFKNDSKIFIAGSTRHDEDAIILDIYSQLVATISDLVLILVPRHPEKAAPVWKMIEQRGLTGQLYSRLDNSAGDVQVVLVDEVGHLNDLYAASDIAFVGGTLADIGGHNILEPVWAGIPVLYGPSVANVVESSRYITEGGYGEKISDGDDLRRKLTSFFSGAGSYRRRRGEDYRPTRVEKTAREILSLLDN